MSDDLVVVRNRLLLRAVGPVILLVGLAALYAVYGLLTTDQVTGLARVLVIVLLLPLAFAGIFGGPTVLMLRETFTRDEITVRPILRTRRIALADATEIRQVRAAVHTGQVAIAIGRLQVVGPRSPRGAAVRAILDQTFTHADEAATILDDWVRRRPELVSDPQVRRIFVDRGVLPQA